MNPLEPLMALLAQAERERDQAWAEAQRTALAHQTAAAQADQLLTYRREYEERWSRQFRSEGRIELVRCYQGFIERLTQAVQQQQQIAAQAAAHCERQRVHLAEHEVRVASVRKLIERRRQELRLSADRIEQKQTDEFGSRIAWSHANALGVPRAA